MCFGSYWWVKNVKRDFSKKCEREVSSGAVVWERTQAGNP